MEYIRITKENIDKEHICCAMSGKQSLAKKEWLKIDTIYCSVCTHRTRKTDFEDDSVQCPYCHRLRDKKAMYCRYCNSSDWTPSSPAEFAEIDKILKDMGY